MGKSKKQAKAKAHRLKVVEQTIKKPVLAELDARTNDANDDLMEPEDIEIAVEVLQSLLERPEALSNQRYKQLKRVGWDFGRVLAEQGSGAGEQRSDWIQSS